MQSKEKRLKLNSGSCESIIAFNSELRALQIVSRNKLKNQQFWGSFKLTDFDQYLQKVLPSIEQLYKYICQNTEELEIEDGRIVLKYNFLKVTRQIVFNLSPMVMFSRQEHQKMLKRISQLENEVSIMRNEREGERKLTLALTQDIVDLYYYQIINFNQLRAYNNHRGVNFIHKTPQNQLPNKGIWTFTILVSSINSQNFNQQSAPYLLVGVNSGDGQDNNIKFKAEQWSGQSKQPEGRTSLQQQDMLKIIINMDLERIAVTNYLRRSQKTAEWCLFSNDRPLWLTLTLFRTNIKTDLFLPPHALNWQEEVNHLRNSRVSTQ